MSKDLFESRAAGWEADQRRVDNVGRIAGAIRERISLAPTMEIMDFGSGTGLLLERIAPFVRKITAVDPSPAMNEQLAAKRDRLECELEILPVDLTETPLDRRFDGIISSMTLHHVEDIPALFRTFRVLLKDDGFIAIADLEREDGSFHGDNTGVFHFGFERDVLLDFARGAGFVAAAVTTASVIPKPQRDYPVLLLTAQRQDR